MADGIGEPTESVRESESGDGAPAGGAPGGVLSGGESDGAPNGVRNDVPGGGEPGGVPNGVRNGAPSGGEPGGVPNDVPGDGAPAGEPGERAGDLAVTATMAVLALTVVAAGIAASTSGWTSVSDVALIELRVRDVPAHLPLVGVYSRYGWNHPGPAEFYGLAPIYRLFGGASVGLLVGALVFQFGCVVASLAALRRFGVPAALAVAGGAIAAFLGMPTEALRSPWNPYVSLGGVVALIAFGWMFAERRRSGALALATVASVMAQTHVVSVPIVAAVVVAAVGMAAVPWRRDPEPPWRHLGLGAALAALVWTPAVVQQFTGSPGNLGELLSNGSGDAPTVGFGAAVRAFTGAFAPLPSSLDRGNVIGFGDPLAWHVPVWLAVVAAGGVAAWSTGRPGRSRRAEKAVLAENAGRAEKAALPENAERAETVRVARVGGAGPISLERVPHDRVSHDPVAHDPVALDPVSHERVSLVRGWLIAAAATLGSIISIAMVTGTAFGYLRIGLRVSSLLWIAISIAALTAALWPRLARPVLGIGVVAAALVLAVVATVSGNPDAGAGEGTEALARAADSVRREVGVPRSEPVEISHSVDFGASLYGPALMVELERRGWNVQSEHMGEALVGEHRVGEKSTVEFRVVALGEVEAYRSDGWERAGAYEPFSEEDREALAELDERYGFDGTFSLEVDEATAERQAELGTAKREITHGRVPAALVWRRLG